MDKILAGLILREAIGYLSIVSCGVDHAENKKHFRTAGGRACWFLELLVFCSNNDVAQISPRLVLLVQFALRTAAGEDGDERTVCRLLISTVKCVECWSTQDMWSKKLRRLACWRFERHLKFG